MIPQNTVGRQFRKLHLTHGITCAVLIVLLTTTRYFLKEKDNNTITHMTLEVIAIAVSFIAVITARFMFFMRTRPALSAVTLKEKIEIFRHAFHLQIILLGSAALLQIILYFILKNNINFFIALGILLLMLFRRPTRVIAAMVLFNSGQNVESIYDDKILL